MSASNPSQATRPSFLRSISSSSAQGLTSITPRKDKPRLYLALFSRGGSNSSSSYSSSVTCDSYHWAILVGPKSASRKVPGTCYQIVHSSPCTDSNTAHVCSYYEETDLTQDTQSEAQSEALLARITIAKVVDESRLQSILRSLPTSNPPSAEKRNRPDSGYDTDERNATSTCLTWVKAAYKAMTNDPGCLRGWISPDDWPDIEAIVRKYMKHKRRQGRFGGHGLAEMDRHWRTDSIATWNFWENRETTS